MAVMLMRGQSCCHVITIYHTVSIECTYLRRPCDVKRSCRWMMVSLPVSLCLLPYSLLLSLRVESGNFAVTKHDVGNPIPVNVI